MANRIWPIAALPALLALAACGTPMAEMDTMPVVSTGSFKAQPMALANCFQSAYPNRFPETVSLERQPAGAGVRLYGLLYGTTNDVVLAPRYYWLLDIQPGGPGSTATLRVGHETPGVWETLQSCE